MATHCHSTGHTGYCQIRTLKAEKKDRNAITTLAAIGQKLGECAARKRTFESKVNSCYCEFTQLPKHDSSSGKGCELGVMAYQTPCNPIGVHKYLYVQGVEDSSSMRGLTSAVGASKHDHTRRKICKVYPTHGAILY